MKATISKPVTLLALILPTCAFGRALDTLHYFSLTNGLQGATQILLVSNTLYGTTLGSTRTGSVFSITIDGTGFHILHLFAYHTNGTLGTVTYSDNTLYGTTYGGRTYFVNGHPVFSHGTVFKIDSAGTGFRTLHYFNGTNGMEPNSGLLLSGNTLYGTTSSGGTSNYGTIFKINTDGSGFKVLHDCGRVEGNPQTLSIISGARILGTSLWHFGPSENGTVFALDADGSDFNVLHNFTGGTVQNGTFIATNDGINPAPVLILSANTVYGVTDGGSSFGPTNDATIFRVNTDGTGFSTLQFFPDWLDGGLSDTRLVLSDDTLYGAVAHSLLNNPSHASSGIIFRINTDGTDFRILHDFTNEVSGTSPDDLILANGVLYGTTRSGGTADAGTVFSLRPDGSGFTVLQNFSSDNNGSEPGGLAWYAGTLYGTTLLGGFGGGGTVFRLSTTDVRPPGSQFFLLSPHVASGKGASLEVTGPLGVTVILDATTNFLDWTPINTQGVVSSPLFLSDPSTNYQRRFYRLRIP